ncbi:radical SAM/SPASM domain-containing protein [Paenibacillus tyrfis]|uniref:radical SAM/SPASM domain-containing protein n=1 Tax=Paenibacillus tyrfis TaxID=1501230 RepID=UPI00209C8608|nr:radical SAM/SPASM domain-containing protein [Paenibacillus tyrfis]MCP1311571.1 SPASM domain-containing protein [Paenibacillus tyrfis]
MFPEVPDFPKAIEVQTTAACNACCIICPHAQVWKEGLRGTMADHLFEKIIAECQKYQSDLRLIPYLNGEPFLDPNMPDKIAMINEQCPESVVEISTNVSMLDEKIISKLYYTRIDDLRLSIFGFSQQTHEKMMPGLKWERVWANLMRLITDPRLRQQIPEINLVMIAHPYVPEEEYMQAQEFCYQHGLKFKHWGFLDRSGNVKLFSNEVRHERVYGCEQHRPLERMHIRVNGDIILCCQDWRASTVIGNVAEMSLREIWLSPAYNKVRASIYRGEGEVPEICKKCKLALTGGALSQ